MKKLNHSLLSTVVSLCLLLSNLLGCSNKQSLDPSIVSKIDAFFNSTLFDITMESKLNDEHFSSLTIYSDHQKIIKEAPDYPDYLEVITVGSHYIKGDGFKAVTEESNGSLFSDEHIDISNYLTFVEKDKDSSIIEFSFHLDKFKEIGSNYLAIQSLNLLFDFAQNQNTLPFYVHMDENETISSFEFFIEKYFDTKTLNSGTLKLFYSINGINDSIVKKTPDLEGYSSIDSKTFSIVKKNVESYLKIGATNFHISQQYLEVYFNEIPEDLYIAELWTSYFNEAGGLEQFSVKILFKDTIFDKVTQTCTYYFCGKPFEIHLSYYETIDIDQKEERPFDINYTPSGAYDYYGTIRYDTALSRVILKTADKVSIIDTSTLQVIKEFEIEGVIVNILIHENVYHVMSVTESSYYGNRDNACKGNIFSIDKSTLEITKLVTVQTYPYNTIIDNRGDIIIVPGFGQGVPIYIYHPIDGSIETIPDVLVSEGSYIQYDKSLDMFVTNPTRASGGVLPSFFYYKNGQYINEKYVFPQGEFTDYGPVLFAFKNYIFNYSYLIDVTDWHEPKAEQIIYPDLNRGNKGYFAFCDNDAVYYVRDFKKERTLIMKVTIADGAIKKTLYSTSTSVLACTFGFANDGNVYLYDATAHSFLVFDLSSNA